MCLVVRGSIAALGGETLVQAKHSAVCVRRGKSEVAHFEIEVPAEWLKVAPDGASALIYGARARSAWVWRDGSGVSLLASTTGSRDVFGCGFVVEAGEVLTLLAQNGLLKGITRDGRVRFAANLRSPASFYPRSFVNLPGRRLGMGGAFFGDPLDTVVTLSLDALLNDPEAVQDAIRARAPAWDRAVDLAIGPCEPISAVLLRDPEETEVPETAEDAEDLSDVGNFAGVYIRSLDNGRLIERQVYSGRAGSGVPITANSDWIAIQATGGIDFIRRGSGTIHHVALAVLDIAKFRAAKIDEGKTVEIVPAWNLVDKT